MKRKSIVLVLLALLAITLIGPAVAAAGNPRHRVEIHPWYDDGKCIPVTSHDLVVLDWGWAACSKGLVIDFLEAIDQHEYELNGKLLLNTKKANKQFDPIQAWAGPTLDWYRCIWDAPHPMVAPWEYRLKPKDLQPGLNTLDSSLSVGYAVLDGGEQCTDWDQVNDECDGEWELMVFDGPVMDTTITIAVDTSCP